MGLEGVLVHLYKDELELHTTNKKVSTQVYTFRERQKFSDHMTFHSEASIRARAGENRCQVWGVILLACQTCDLFLIF